MGTSFCSGAATGPFDAAVLPLAKLRVPKVSIANHAVARAGARGIEGTGPAFPDLGLESLEQGFQPIIAPHDLLQLVKQPLETFVRSLLVAIQCELGLALANCHALFQLHHEHAFAVDGTLNTSLCTFFRHVGFVAPMTLPDWFVGEARTCMSRTTHTPLHIIDVPQSNHRQGTRLHDRRR